MEPITRNISKDIPKVHVKLEVIPCIEDLVLVSVLLHLFYVHTQLPKRHSAKEESKLRYLKVS